MMIARRMISLLAMMVDDQAWEVVCPDDHDQHINDEYHDHDYGVDENFVKSMFSTVMMMMVIYRPGASS